VLPRAATAVHAAASAHTPTTRAILRITAKYPAEDLEAQPPAALFLRALRGSASGNSRSPRAVGAHQGSGPAPSLSQHPRVIATPAASNLEQYLHRRAVKVETTSP
jgi:hypothetical protein